MFCGNLVPEAAVEKPPEADAWYKMALEKARAIAQSMKDGGPAPVNFEQDEAKPDVMVKTEMEVKPEMNPVKQEVDEYGSGSSAKATVQAGPSVPAPSGADPAISMNLLRLKMLLNPFLKKRDPTPNLPQCWPSWCNWALSCTIINFIFKSNNFGKNKHFKYVYYTVER